MAITFNNDFEGATPGTATSITVAGTVNSGSNITLVSGLSGFGTPGFGDPPATWTWNGDALTLIDTQTFVRLGYIVNPDVGSFNLVATGLANDGQAMTAIVLNGTDTADPVGATNKGTGSGTSSSLSVTTDEDNTVVVDNITYQGTLGTLAAASGQTETADQNIFGTAKQGAGYKAVASAGSSAQNWSWTTSASWWQVSAQINEGVAAASSVAYLIT